MPRSRQPKEIDLWRVNAQDLLQGAKPSELHFLTLIEAGANLGFAGANNLACRFALSIPSISYVWFLNTDTVVDPFAYEELFKRCELDPTIGQCGATLLFYDQPFLVQALGGSLYNPITGRAKHFAFGVPRSKLPDKSQVEPYLAYVAGASLFSTRKFLEATGPMREDYFLYFEELDWAMRRPKHLRMAWEPAALVYHKEGASIGSASTGRGSDMSLYYLTRNALLFTARYRRVYLPTVIARVVVEMWRYHRKGDPRAVRTLIASVRDFIMRRYGQAALSQEMSTNHTLREL
jgi:GT2 family glycosyltransferase